ELACGGVDRVARVRAALIAHDEVGALGEHVDDLPLALVPPLSADDHDAVDLGSEHGSSGAGHQKKGPGGGALEHPPRKTIMPPRAAPPAPRPPRPQARAGPAPARRTARLRPWRPSRRRARVSRRSPGRAGPAAPA